MALKLFLLPVLIALCQCHSLPEDNILSWSPLQEARPAEPPVDSPSNSLPDTYGPFPESLQPCTTRNCRAPYCRCCSSDIPGGLNVSTLPQLVLFSFQNAVNVINYKAYKDMFQGRRNPNGCPRVGTFFVSHNYTDYSMVQNLYKDGHEIGDNTVTFPSTPFPEPPSQYVSWRNELASQKYILSKWANIPMYEIRGMRAPNLKPGGDAQLNAMKATGLIYDSSRTTTKHIHSPGLLYPWTYDFASSQECVVGPCPQNPHPGIWEIPLNGWQDKQGHVWAVPQAVTDVTTEDQAYMLLKNKLMEHYKSTNRAPLPIVLDSSWLVTDWKLRATKRFMDFLDHFHDVWTVTNWQTMQWVMNPVPVCSLPSYGPFSCSSHRPDACDPAQATTCLFDEHRRLFTGPPGKEAYKMVTCVPTCPSCYPTVNDPWGKYC